MATLRFSFPTDFKRGRQGSEETKLAACVLSWNQKTLETMQEHLATLQQSFQDAGKGLFASVHGCLTTLEVAVDNVCLRHTRDADRRAISQAFSQAINDIWTEISSFASPRKKASDVLKAVTTLQQRALETHTHFLRQLQLCEEKVPTSRSQTDSLETVKLWDESLQRPARMIVNALKECEVDSPRALIVVREALGECFGRKEGDMVRELEKEVEKVRWRADVLAKCLRETQRNKDESDLRQRISDLEASNQTLRAEISTLESLNQSLQAELPLRTQSSELKLAMCAMQKNMEEMTFALSAQVDKRLQSYECGLTVLRERLKQVPKADLRSFQAGLISRLEDVKTSIKALSRKPSLSFTNLESIDLPSTQDERQTELLDLRHFIYRLQENLRLKTEELQTLQTSVSQRQPEPDLTNIEVQTEQEAWKAEVLHLTNSVDEADCLTQLESALAELKRWKAVGQTPETTARQLTGSLQELEEEHAVLSRENLTLLGEVEELRIEKSSSERLLSDLQQTLREVQQGWAQAKQRQEDLQTELQTAEQLTGDSEQVKRLLDNLDERERELQHLKTLIACYREQITTLRADVQHKTEENVSLEEQQSVALRELEVLQKPADAVLLEAAHTAAELSLLQEKYAAEQGRAQQLAGDNKALDAKNRLLRATLAEMQSERVFDDLHKEQSLDFEEDAISCADPLTRSMSDDLRTLLGLSEEAEVCRKVSYNSREWVLVQLPRQAFCWIQLSTAGSVSREQAAHLYDEVARLLQPYELSPDVPLAVARVLCLLERAQLISSAPPLRPLQTSGQVSNPERLKGLVLELLRLLPNL